MIRRFVCTKVALAAFAVALVAAFALPSDAAAQGTTTGSITGIVIDNAGEPLAEATVIVRNVETGSESRLQTNAEGRYRAGLLRPGMYTVRAEFPPLDPVERGPIRVAVGETRSLAMALAPVEMEAIVARIEAEAASIDITQGGVVETVNEDQIESLPTAGRDFTDFIALSGLISPQQNISTGGQFSIGGARTSGTNVTIDGADANNAFFGENRGSSRLPFAFSLESIKEFQIITNGYDVEYGKFSGGQINAVTKGGTNEFDGSFFVFGRNESLTADNFDDSPPTDFSQTQFGGVVSGPIVEDELHFFVSGDFQIRDQPVFALDPARARASEADINEFIDILENVYGLPGTSTQGQFEETADEVALFGRLDWTPSQNHRVTVRANYTSFDNENDRLSSFGNEAITMAGRFEDRAFSIVGELNSIVNESATAYNTLRIHWSDEDRPRPGNSTLPSVTVDTEGGGDLGYGGNFFGILFDNRLEESKIQITDNLTWQTGNHTLKIGTDNIFSSTTNKFWLNGNGFFDFDNLEDFRNRDPGFSFRFVPAGPDGSPESDPSAPVGVIEPQEWAFYVQDEWQATDKLLLNLGLRYDTTVFTNEPSQFGFEGFTTLFDEVAAAAGHPGIDVSTVPEDRNNFGPRVSFTYDANGDQTSVWRGGAGLFHARIPTVLHGNVLQATPDPILAVICIGAATPEFNYENWQDPDNIPSTCAFDGFQGDPFGIGILGTPQFVTWDPDFEMPQTLKMNLGYEQRVGEAMKAGVQVLYSRTWNNFHVQDLNLQDQVFTNREGRPVFVETDEYDPTDEPDEGNFGRSDEVNRLFFQTDTGRAEIWNLQFNLQGTPTENLFLSANYTYNYAFDNTSFVCCTASAGMFDIPTGGNPNAIGSFGDEDEGNWGPSDFERRHTFVANATWDLPAQFQIGAIYRIQSGNPYTPVVEGDINQDGTDDNDRAFIPDPNSPTRVQFENAGELAEYQAILANSDNECLQEAVGTIIGRNTCNNPMWHSLDLKIKKGFNTFSGQEIELTLDLFNIFDALGMEAGEFVFEDNELLQAEGLADDGETVIYSVNDQFGRRIPVGFGQLQFQAQLGLRYRF